MIFNCGPVAPSRDIHLRMEKGWRKGCSANRPGSPETGLSTDGPGARASSLRLGLAAADLAFQEDGEHEFLRLQARC